MPIAFVSIGTGDRGDLTPRARDCLTAADLIFVMAVPDSWVLRFLVEVVGDDRRIRGYRPASVMWTRWRDHPVFGEIADELAARHHRGESLAVVVAGDFSLYSVAVPLIPRLRERGLAWTAIPGVSFLGMAVAEAGEPLTFEGENLIVVGSDDLDDLQRGLATAEAAVVYHPSGMAGLVEYSRSASVASAYSVVTAPAGGRVSLTDLKTDTPADLYGLVMLRGTRRAGRPRAVAAHIGLNGWDRDGRLVALAYPDCLWVAADGRPSSLRPRHRFAGDAQDASGLFIDSRNAIFVGLSGFAEAPFGRTYVSRDEGVSFVLILPVCCSRFDEAPDGDLFAAAPAVQNRTSAAASLLWSSDGGQNWCDVAAPEWGGADVRCVAIEPATGRVYATLSGATDAPGLWRSGGRRPAVRAAAAAGERRLAIDSAADIGAGSRLVIPGSPRESVAVAAVAGSDLLLAAPLAAPVSAGTRLYLLDWRLACSGGAGRRLRFGTMAFYGGALYLASDGSRRHEGVTVWRCREAAGSAATVLVPALTAPPGSGRSASFLERDRSGRLWAGIVPVGGEGQVWGSDDGIAWDLAATAVEEDLPLWRGTHTFRDATLGHTGDGRSLSAPDGAILAGHLNHSLVLAGGTKAP